MFRILFLVLIVLFILFIAWLILSPLFKKIGKSALDVKNQVQEHISDEKEYDKMDAHERRKYRQNQSSNSYYDDDDSNND